MNSKPLSYLEALNTDLVVNAREYSDLFWNSKVPLSKDSERKARDLRRGNGTWICGKAAQESLRPAIEQAHAELSKALANREVLRWIVLVRGAMGTFLRAFFDQQTAPDLTLGMRRATLSMLHLSLIEYGDRKPYSAEYQTQHDMDANLFPEYSAVSKTEITVLRGILNQIVELARLDKLYRVTGRGTPIAMLPDGRIAGKIITEAQDSYALYDLRVDRQGSRGEHFVAGGFPGSVFDSTWKQRENSLLGMAWIQTASVETARSTIRKMFPGEFNFAHYTPILINGGLVFQFLRRMSQGVARLTGGLSTEEIVGCLRALTSTGMRMLEEPWARMWMLCFGIVPIKRQELVGTLADWLDEYIPSRSEEGRRDVVERFLGQIQHSGRTDGSFSAKNCLMRYMTASTAFAPIDSDGTVLCDFVMLIEHLNDWFVKMRFDGWGKEDTRGRLFESWGKAKVLTPPEKQKGLRITGVECGVDIRLPTKKPFTDIDILISVPPWLLVVQCKNRIMSDEHFQAEADAVWHRWNKLHEDLRLWDKKTLMIFEDNRDTWRLLNPTVAHAALGCVWAIPLVMTPRAEWVPCLNEDFLIPLHDDRDKEYPFDWIPRICTLDDVEVFIQSGGSSISWNCKTAIDISR